MTLERNGMQPWFIATQRLTSRDGVAWEKYVAWSGLKHLDEVVSLDPMLCPTLLPDIKDEYWPHIVNEDFMLNFFVDLEHPGRTSPLFSLFNADQGAPRLVLLISPT